MGQCLASVCDAIAGKVDCTVLIDDQPIEVTVGVWRRVRGLASIASARSNSVGPPTVVGARNRSSGVALRLDARLRGNVSNLDLVELETATPLLRFGVRNVEQSQEGSGWAFTIDVHEGESTWAIERNCEALRRLATAIGNRGHKLPDIVQEGSSSAAPSELRLGLENWLIEVAASPGTSPDLRRFADADERTNPLAGGV